MTTTAKPKELADVVDEWRSEAAILRRRGQAPSAQLLEQCADEAAAVTSEFMRWLSEEEAALRSGFTPAKVRRSITLAYLHTEHVEEIGRNRYRLRACIVPRRQHLEMLRADAQRAAS